MRLLVTGLTGTLAPHLAHLAEAAGWRILGWDRHAVPADDGVQARAWLAQARPDAIAHLAIGNVVWAGLLAGHAHEHGIPLLFTSTAMVFDHDPDGPHDVADARTARDDYGRGKIACEDAIRRACPAAAIARLGWQIDERAVGNNMLAELDRWQARDGRIVASSRWTPACSFMADTCEALLALLTTRQAGTVHLDSNAAEAWRFDEIVMALKTRFARDWTVEVDGSAAAYAHDQRLVGGSATLPALSTRLPSLARRGAPTGRPCTSRARCRRSTCRLARRRAAR
ncbi:sugar nucleotide-binding protein [Scleromatobacter humisilvae]|uniref:dTDP-4-dehydrorhamnose reductase n=1 Tax=Scleromatobacter humisilvae TaxID=2897159 RepID=A0A9X1YLA0_9BURK|nr:sugar nucleotide-binding protein [Scleromatobacter humisilvae]MCK9688644.1 NAD(P)-dependent oxidoreductase [Scleromatobacter humisilvae]